MSREDDSPFAQALRAAQSAMDEASVPWMFIGGLAVIALGVPRFTADIDMTVLAAGTELPQLVGFLERHAIVPRIPDSLEFARRNMVLLVHHQPTLIPLDVSMAWLPFEEEAIRESHEIKYAGISVRVPRPEDLIIYKLVASRPKDVDDVRKPLALYRGDVSLTRIRSVLQEFCAALEDTRQLEVFENLAVLARRARVDLLGRPAWILSAEDTIVFKVLFDRPKDWVDIERVVALRAGQLDVGYLETWLAHWLGPADARAKRLADLFDRHRS